jgi:predicted dehydrogenase
MDVESSAMKSAVEQGGRTETVGNAASTTASERGGNLRVGVVGCGYWGAKHVRVLSGLADVGRVVVIDRDPAIRDAITAAFPAVESCASLETALPLVDALVVATPPQSHATVALAGIAAGKHVMIEKPMTATLTDAQRLVAAADAAGVVLMAGHTFEFNPAVRELRRRLDQGELGRPYYIHSARLNLGLFRSDVDVVWDLAPHDISIMNYLLDAVPDRVSAWGSAHACREVNDLAYLKLHYDSLGVTGHVHVSWLDPRKVRTVTVVGSQKMAIYDDVADERLRIFDCGVEAGDPVGDDGSLVPYERPFAYRHGDIVSPRISGEEPLMLENRHFVDCIRGAAEPLSDGRSGLAVVAVLDAVDRAIASGETVDVASIPQRRQGPSSERVRFRAPASVVAQQYRVA